MTPTPPAPDAPPPAPTNGPAAPPSPLVASFHRAIRLIFIGLILLIGWAFADLFRNVFSPDPFAPPPTGQLDTPTSVSPPILSNVALDGGGWSVGETGWSIRRSEIPATELAAKLASSGEPLAAGRPRTPLEDSLLTWLRGSGASAKVADDVRTYTLPFRKAQVRIVTQPLDGFERIRLVQATWTAGVDKLNLFELVPAAAVRGPASVPPLLPIPEGTEVVARRWVGDRVVAELVGPWPNGRPMPESWAAAGWVLRPPAAGAADPGFAVYANGKAEVQVWNVVPPEAEAAYLLLIRPNAEGAP